MPRTSPLLHFVAPPELVRRLDDFRFARRFPSRAAAVKALLDYALRANPDLKPDERDSFAAAKE